MSWFEALAAVLVAGFVLMVLVGAYEVTRRRERARRRRAAVDRAKYGAPRLVRDEE